MDLQPEDFPDFFRAVHGHDPFPWQRGLVNRLAEFGEWPDVLDLPTGTGKTAAIDAAVFHLALSASEPWDAALRIAFVVDRRIVVDDAFARAQRVAKALRSSLTSTGKDTAVVKAVAIRLLELAGEDAPPLIARRLRGGAPLEQDWARTPAQPTILCSTVDQVGSRLLFRGYGVSDRMKPVHAGLLGTGSLILLDEAHLSNPFRQTLEAARDIGGARIRTALLSATPGAHAQQPLGLSDKDRNHPVLRKRLDAVKPAVLRELGHTKPAAVAVEFAREARAMTERLRKGGVSPPAVGVIVNRVALARRVQEAIREDSAGEDDFDALLLIGPSRAVDRDRTTRGLTPFRTGASDAERSEARALVIVATQCLEVGADTDLDGLVTQVASLDALLQRFGRLNRAGRAVPAEGRILARPEDIARKPDPVYGDRMRQTWEALQGIADDGQVDFGVEALPQRMSAAGIHRDVLAAERLDAPVFMPAYLALWSQTSPRPAADPDVDLFLHGAGRSAASVSIVWRGDITEDSLDRDIDDLIELVPPRAAEAVEVPLWAARAWLQQDTPKTGDDMADVPEHARESGRRNEDHTEARSALRWAGPGDPRTGVVKPGDISVGDMLVVPAVYGGCDAFGWAPGSMATVKDVAEVAAKPYWGQRCAVRITRDIAQEDHVWSRVAAELADESITGRDLVERLLELLPDREAAAGDENETEASDPHDARASLEALRRAKGRIDVHFPYAGGAGNGAVIIAERGVEDAVSSGIGLATTEDDRLSHGRTSPVPLDGHCHRVAGFVKRYAHALGLTEIAADLELAALLHDIGKADPRFQIMLSGGDVWNRPDGPPLAKSGRSWSRSAWSRAGLPRGWRHEAQSVRAAQVHSRLAEARDPGLVLWLIGSHHGLGRPLFNFHDPDSGPELKSWHGLGDWQAELERPGPQSLAFEFEGDDWPALFERLKQRYGTWGLAHLETVLRLADHRASEEENA